MVDSSPRRLRFGRFEIDAAYRKFKCDDVPVHLGDRALDVLICLMNARGRIVSKSELMQAVWPGRIVEENSLEAQICILRRTLGPERTAIRTVAGRGYKFVGVPEGAAEGMPAGASVRLPASISRLIGRKEQLDYVADVIGRHRLLTLVGAGGIGKTRLAVELARQVSDRFPDRVCMAELASVSDAQFVPVAVALALGFTPADSKMSFERISSVLGAKRCLLVLDNCEHLIGAAAAMVCTLLQASPGLRVLATSREALRVDGEFVYSVPPLDVPDMNVTDVNLAMASSAMQLFDARLSYGQVSGTDDARIVALKAKICRRLDGIPLAIEFAAARVQVFGISGVAERLENLFDLLTGGARTALPRQQTLIATLDWSYELLPPQERIVLARLGVFADRFSLEAAQAVVVDQEITATCVLDCMVNLVAKSLVSTEAGDPEAKLRLLDMTRDYARKKLDERGETQAFFRKHAQYLCRRFQAIHLEESSMVTVDWIADCKSNLEDLRAAISWCFSEDGDVGLGIDLTTAVVPYWIEDSLVDECLANVSRALEFINVTGRSGLRSEMKLQTALGKMLLFVGALPEKGIALPEAGVAFSRALTIAEQFEDLDFQSIALWGLCTFTYLCGSYSRLVDFANRFRAVCAAKHGQMDLAVGDSMLGMSHLCVGRLQDARRELEKMLSSYQSSLSRSHLVRFNFDQTVVAQVTLAHVLWLSGQADEAFQLQEEAMAEAERIGHGGSLWYALMVGVFPITLATRGISGLEYPIEFMIDRGRSLGTPVWETRGRFWQGLVSMHRGEAGAYRSIVAPSLYSLGKTIHAPFLTGYLSALCDELVRSGDSAEAFRLATASLERARRVDNHSSLPELMRLRGEMELAARGTTAHRAAEEAFVASLTTSASIGAKSWQLRAATSLAKLLVRQGNAGKATDVLTPVYDSFSGGFNTVDMVAAKHLLDTI
jgi:predicted ATPase/DNA-binding winged helix-turn-helix (wHTH) protein